MNTALKFKQNSEWKLIPKGEKTTEKAEHSGVQIPDLRFDELWNRIICARVFNRVFFKTNETSQEDKRHRNTKP